MNNIFDRMASSNHQLANSNTINSDEESPNAVLSASASHHEPLTSNDVKNVTQELLKHGYLEEAQKADLFRCAIVYEQEILAALEPLDLEMRLDSHRGIAFLVVAKSAYTASDDSAAWLHPLVRRQRLTLEQSLLIAILRQAFALHEQESGIGHSDARLSVDDIFPQFMAYFQDTGSDARNESRLLSLLDQLKAYGIVSEVDNKHEVTIRPLIAHLANPESLSGLLDELGTWSQSGGQTETACDGG